MSKMIGLARLGRDAEVRTTSQGESVATLALAFSYGRKGSDGKRPTQWVDGALWGKRAEALAPYLLKGGLVSVLLEEVHLEQGQPGLHREHVDLRPEVGGVERAGRPPGAQTGQLARRSLDRPVLAGGRRGLAACHLALAGGRALSGVSARLPQISARASPQPKRACRRLIVSASPRTWK